MTVLANVSSVEGAIDAGAARSAVEAAGSAPRGGRAISSPVPGARADVASKRSLYETYGPLLFPIAALAVAVAHLPNGETVVPGVGLRDVAIIEGVLFVSGMMSGLSGFGFSAVGAACMLVIEPILQVPLLQALSTGNQLLSVGQLRDDMPKSWGEFWAGPGPCIAGGAAGVPIGIWLLSHLPAPQLMTVFGILLVMYSVYSALKPAGAKLRGFDGPAAGASIGFLGGIAGGFTAFPGAALVVWTGLRGLSKKQSRAVLQPYIVASQVYSLALVAWLHPQYLDRRFWLLLATTVPAVLPGTLVGLHIYRRTSDVSFKRICHFLLGLSGLSLLLKVYGGALVAALSGAP